jgi:hypothetical protein
VHPRLIQPGDLVKHKHRGYVGLIVKCDARATPFDDFRPDRPSASDILYHIEWMNDAAGACWYDEIEVINE